MSNTETITSKSHEVFYYTPEKEKKHLGTVVIDASEKMRAKRQYFLPDNESPYRPKNNDTKRFDLGLGSDRISFIDPAQAVEPLLEKGWEIKNVLARRGGSEIKTTLVNPDVHYRDTIEYDKSRWQAEDVHGVQFISTVDTSITVHCNLHIGFYGARYAGGLFRRVCSNLAEALILGLPTYNYRHNTWRVEEVSNRLAEMGYSMAQFDALPTGPIIGTIESVGKIKRALIAYRDQLQGFTEKSPWFDNSPRQFNVFKRVNTPDWTLNNFLDELTQLEQNYAPADPVNAYMVLNAYTNAINWHNRQIKLIDRGTWAALANSNDVIQAFSDLSRMLSFFDVANFQAGANVYSDLNPTGTVPKRKGYKTIEVQAAHAEEENNKELPIQTENALAVEPDSLLVQFEQQLNNVN